MDKKDFLLSYDGCDCLQLRLVASSLPPFYLVELMYTVTLDIYSPGNTNKHHAFGKLKCSSRYNNTILVNTQLTFMYSFAEVYLGV